MWFLVDVCVVVGVGGCVVGWCGMECVVEIGVVGVVVGCC